MTVLDDLSGGGSDEGRAMLQLIHDVAPGADLSFHTAFTGQANFAQGILDLRVDGADVIVDDVIYFAEPFFQDGIIAQAVDQAVADGALYFSSAGNQARDSYESAFVDSGIDLDFGSFQVDAHDFDPGAGVDAFQAVTIGGGSTITISFQWDEAFFSVSGGLGAQNDIDIFLFDSAETTLVDSSSSNNIGGDPLEILQFTNNGSTNTFNIAIGRFAGADPGLMKYVTFGSFNILEHDTNSGTTAGHAAASGGQAVAAAFYDDTPAFGTNPPLVESFSSAGPTTILFDTAGNRLSVPDVRQTPQITAPDGTNTTFFGSDVDGDGFPNFFGTSAAAPHAAAAAALILDGVPGLVPEDVYRVMQVTAIDMDDPLTAGFDVGADSRTGYGLIQVDDALAALNADPAGTTGDDVIAGRSVTDAISGGDGADALFGLSGDDTLTGGTGDDVLEGGAGNDLAAFSGLSTECTVTLLGAGAVSSVDLVSSRDGTDSLLGVERAQFSDGTYFIDGTNNAPTDLDVDDLTVDENVSGAIVGNVSVADFDQGDTHGFVIDDNRFEVVSGQLKLKDGQSLDFATEPTVNVQVTATDQDGTGLSYAEGFLITVNDSGQEPTVFLSETFSDGDFAGWTSLDEGTVNGPSSWSVLNQEVRQTSNIMSTDWTAQDHRLGTTLIWDDAAAQGWQDYTLDATLRSTDNDGIGLAFYYADAQNYYKVDFDYERPFIGLFEVANGVETTLASVSGPGYTIGTEMQISLTVTGGEITVLRDGVELFGGPVQGGTLTGGTVGLYSWANTGAHFDDIVVTSAGPSGNALEVGPGETLSAMADVVDPGQDVLAGGSASSLNIADVLDMGGTGEGSAAPAEVFGAGAAPDLQSLLPDPVADPLI